MKTVKFLSMAALVTAGAILASCEKEEPAPDPQENPEAVETPADNIVVCSTTINLAAGTTKALTPEGVKTFAESEKIAIFYKNTSGSFVKAVSEPLTVVDITNEGKSASFTFQLANPDKTVNVRYVYPPDMITEDGMMPNPALLVAQDGTLDSVSSNLDLAYGYGPWDGENLPGITLENQLAILAITLKNADGSSDITGTITGMTLSDGEQSCTVTRSAAPGPIYVAIPPISNKNIEITATAGPKAYIKSLTGKTYAANNGYNVSWRMTQVPTDLSKVNSDYTAGNGETLTGTLGGNYKVSIADGAVVTLDGVTINGTNNASYKWAGLNCLGDATIILADGSTNTVKGFYETYPGIHVRSNKKLTIQGTGTLNASSYGYGAGIGGGYAINCGNIEIQNGIINASCIDNAAAIGSGRNARCGNIDISGGYVTATSGWGAGIGTGYYYSETTSCGNISITGGTVIATGGHHCAGIGSGSNGKSGAITISSAVTSVTATKGSEANDCIGKGWGGSCGGVKFGDQTMYDGLSWTTTPTSGSTYSGLSLTISQTAYEADTWTLTPVAP